MKCGHWIGAERRYCRSADQVRHFLPGHRCPDHTPNALKGLPETPPGPGKPRGLPEPPPGSNTPKEDR